MNIIRITSIFSCGAFLTIRLLAAAPEELAKKADAAIIPKVELQNSTPADAFKAITKATGIPIFYNPGKAEQASITLSLSSVPASEALKYITSLANLKFSFQKDGILVVPSGPSANAAIPNAPVPAKEFVVQPAPGAATRVPSSEPVVIREFKITPATFIRTLRQAAPPRPGETDDLLFARFLKERHVEIQALTMNGQTGRLFVRTTNPDMQKISTFVEQLDAGKLPQPAAP